MRSIRRVVAIGVSLAAAASLGIAVPATAGAAKSTASAHQRPVTAGADYLALGDSVSFGYREPANLPTPDYADAQSFVGFPEDVAAQLGLHVANASCPGETSASLIDAGRPSNGCETQAGSTAPGYRALFPLHKTYAGSQLDYGVSYLRAHPGTRLVTLMIGANDAFLCQSTTADQCASELPRVLRRISRNVATILSAVRDRGGYTGQIVLVNYYSLNYASAVKNATSTALNHALDAPARTYRARVADGYTAMRHAAAQAGGRTCAAGLLTTLTTGGCGVHPSVAGQDVLAGAVDRTVAK